MGNIHFILQGKGGVGKSLVANLLFQYLRKRADVMGIDTDPVNSTLAGYKELTVLAINIMNGADIDNCKFDELMHIALDSPAGSHIIIDNGASSFIPLCSYLIENNALQILLNTGHHPLLHTVVTGGQAILDTTAGLATLATTFPEVPLVVWLNQYFGDIAIGPLLFEEFTVYQTHKNNIASIIQIPHRKHSTFTKDLDGLYARRETFDAAVNSSLPIMTRQRLIMYWHDVQAEIDKARLI